MQNTVIELIMLAGALVVPVVLLIGGVLLRAMVSSEPNAAAGFRTKLSMRSQQTWDYANNACGALWIRLGWILLAAGGVAMGIVLSFLPADSLFSDQGAAVYGWSLIGIVSAQIAAMLLSILHVQKELRLRFDAEGRPI